MSRGTSSFSRAEALFVLAGDMYPYTTEGKLMATITILVGLVMLALPMAILGTNFVEERTAMLEEQLGEVRHRQLSLSVVAS